MERSTIIIPSNESTEPWQKVVAVYQQPDTLRSIWQMMNTFIPFGGLWYLMYLSLDISYWLTLLLALPAAGLYIRIFIILHDCGHGSFLKSQKVNDFIGTICGIITFTPYYQWRHDHAIHHATIGNLDRRSERDFWVMTVEEYLQAPGKTRLAYRIYRNPLFLLIVAPLLEFLIRQRFPRTGSARREHRSVYHTDAALLAVTIIMSITIGLKSFVMVQLPILQLGAMAGVWLFYVQHQFEGGYFRKQSDWDYEKEALKGSSFYRLPKILQWLTGNIGFHHIHHLCPRIPNYKLEKCHRQNPQFQGAPTLSIRSSLKSLSLRLWDERRQRLVGFADLNTDAHAGISTTISEWRTGNRMGPLRSNQRFVFLVNPKARNGRSLTRLQRLLKTYPDIALGGRVEHIDSVQQAERVLRQCKPSVIPVAVGGDGTLNLLVQVLRKLNMAQIPMGVIPLGTGNAFAYSIGAGSVKNALQILRKGTAKSLDLMVTSHQQAPVALISLSVGFESYFVRNYGDRRQYTSLIGGLYGLFRARQKDYHDVSITLDGQTFLASHDRFFSAGLYDMPCYAFGLRVFPNTDPADGRAEAVVYTSAGSYWHSLWQGVSATEGAPSKTPRLKHWQVAEINTAHPIQIDGETFSGGNFTVNIEQEAFTVLTMPE